MKAITTVPKSSGVNQKHKFGVTSSVKKLQPVPKRLCVPDLNGIQIMLLDQILFFKSNGNYTEIRLVDGQQFIFAKTLKTFEALLPNEFFRIHNQYIVNKMYISRIEHSGMIRLSSNHLVPLARGRRAAFNSWLMDASMIGI